MGAYSKLRTVELKNQIRESVKGQEPVSIRRVAKEFHISREFVRKVLVENNIPLIRPLNHTLCLTPEYAELHRCPGCGGLVVLPCLLCKARILREKNLCGRKLRHMV